MYRAASSIVLKFPFLILMNTHPIKVRAAFSLAGILVVASLPCFAVADDQAKILTAIRQTGATVKRVKQGLEIDFHLKARQSAAKTLPLVAKLENVVWLNLANSDISDGDLAHLKKLKELRAIHLEKTEVGDEGIRHLTGLEQLEYLNLYSTNITDKSLEQLAKLPSLRKLYVWKTNVTGTGTTQLAKALPKLRIVRGNDLAKLPSKFPTEEDEPKPKTFLQWVKVERRDQAPGKSDNGVNCQVWFENQSGTAVKLYWISYGAGDLKLYGTIKSGGFRKQNSYARNAWLITDPDDRPLGYFIAKDDDARAVIPATKN